MGLERRETRRMERADNESRLSSLIIQGLYIDIYQKAGI